MKPATIGAAVISVILLAPVALILALVVLMTPDGCDTGTTGSVEGYDQQQLDNARQIIKAGKDAGLGGRDQMIGVMTAIGESTLRVLDHGDEAGPDSRGMFQQRGNWGPLADRMDPYTSAGLFFTALQKIPEAERKTLAPTIVAHRVQVNADPYHYEKFQKDAEAIMALLGGDTDSGVCSTTGQVGKDGWARPAEGPINSPYGLRGGIMHTGVDLNGGGCGGSIYAANAGTVTYTGTDNLGNGVVYIDHGGIETRYVHMYVGQIYVRTGQTVTSGQHIADVGSSGASTGCHLHFEVKIPKGAQHWGDFQDPIPFLAERGITY